MEKEEIIELTEVVEEGPAFPARKERPERSSPGSEDRRSPVRPPAANEPRSGLSEPDPRILKEILARQAEAWFAKEGVQILERIAREAFPQIAEKVLRREIEKLKEESGASEKE